MDKRFWLTLLIAGLFLSGACCKKVEKRPEEAPAVKTEEYQEQGGQAPEEAPAEAPAEAPETESGE